MPKVIIDYFKHRFVFYEINSKWLYKRDMVLDIAFFKAIFQWALGKRLYNKTSIEMEKGEKAESGL